MSTTLIFSQLFIPILIINLCLGLFVYLTNKKNIKNKLFLGLAIGTSFWIGGMFLIGSTPYDIGGKLSFSGALISAWFFMLFTFQFPKPIYINKGTSLKKIGWLLTILFILLSLLTPLIVKKEFSKETTFGVSGEFGILYPLWSTYFIFLMGFGLFNLIKGLYNPSQNELEKKQLKYFFLGSSSTILITATTNLILPLFGFYQYSKLGPLGTIFLISFTTLAILRYHLLDLKVILTELLVAAMASLLMILFFLMPSGYFKIFTLILLILFLIFGYYLIKATHNEVRRKEEAEQLLKAKTEFLSIASHQLRTPLTAIIGYSSMLKEGDYGSLPDKARGAMSHIWNSSQRMIKLVNDFLSVSRLETGKTVLKTENFSLNELISQIIADLIIKAKEKNLYIKYEEPQENVIMRMDPEKLKEAISNLIDNSIHYTEKGGITITTNIKKSKILIAITDTGAGMAEEEISKLFESFSRGSAGNELNTQGSGLGLYIAKKFVQLHNGKIWAESKGKNKGSVFFIELPNK